VEELMNALSHGSEAMQSGKSASFQALVRVKVKKGYQVLGAKLITVHPLHPPELAGHK
jgi:hypothetical protein